MKTSAEMGVYSVHEKSGFVSIFEIAEILWHISQRRQSGFSEKIFEKDSDLIFYTIPFLDRHIAIPLHPDLVHELLIDHGDVMRKASWDSKILREYLGDSLFTASGGESWEQRRKLMRLKFNHHKIKYLEPIVCSSIGRMIQSWIEQSAKGQEIALSRDITDFALQIICQFIFHSDLQEKREKISGIVDQLVQHISHRFLHGGFPSRGVPTLENVRVEQNYETVINLFLDIIQERKTKLLTPTQSSFWETENVQEDLLDIMIQAKDEETQQPLLTDYDIARELVTMMVAGHETTAITATWALYLLSHYPQVKQQVKEETNAAFGNRNDISLSELKGLPYLDALIKETLRLYPPLWVLPRQNIEEITLSSGIVIPQFSYIIVSPYVIHRNPKFWQDPECFRPERFLSPSEKESAQQAFLPFGYGERMCLGKGIAMMELPLLLTRILQQVDVSVSSHVNPALQVSLRPEHSLTARISALR